MNVVVDPFLAGIFFFMIFFLIYKGAPSGKALLIGKIPNEFVYMEF